MMTKQSNPRPPSSRIGVALLGLLLLTPGIASAAIPAVERLALTTLYTSTNGGGWTDRTNWRNADNTDFGAPGTECTWFGVICDATESHVKELVLSSNLLAGTIPSQIGSLSGLQYLELWDNQLSGNIPPQIGSLSGLLGLDLYSNALTGSIPPELGNLSNLQFLFLDSNLLSGAIPSQIGGLTNLQYLWLSSNQLTGPIPTQIGTLSGLAHLYLDDNLLSGSIPSELGNLSSLVDLVLSDNLLTGSIPPQLGALANLRALFLWGNQLSGGIPAELGSLAALQYLYLDGNQLTGSIPSALGSLTGLLSIDLRENLLSGSIPPELGNLVNLLNLSLYHNQLSGNLPSQLGNLTALQSLYLSANQLSGAIPPEMANLTGLMESANWGLDLRWNALHSSDAPLIAFLNTKQYGGDWQGTQTVAPANVTAGTPTYNTMLLSWTPITYTGDTGGYRVWARAGANGKYEPVGMSAAKTDTSLVVTGLNPAVAYNFQVQAVTNPHVNNANTVASEFSAEVAGTTAGSLTTVQVSVDTTAGSGLISNVNGVLEPGEMVAISPSWRNTDTIAHAANGTASAMTGPAGATYSIGDPTAGYGLVLAGATANCNDATGNCYALGVSNPAARPIRHWDIQWTETLSTGETKTWTVHVGDSFADVPRSHWGYRFIETIFHNRVTSGCNAVPFQYCPASTLTRAEMAVLLLMAKHGTSWRPPASTGTVFADVPIDHWAGDFIEQLVVEDITDGCAPGLYCPTAPMTRAIMAQFLIMAEHGPGYIPPPATGMVFLDVPIDHPQGAFIEQLAAEGITSGCDVGLYCPDGTLQRAEMAVFLSVTFGLTLNE